MRSIVFILVCFMSLAIPLAMQAQIADPATPILQLNPAFPEASEPYTVTLVGSSERRASIRWFVNGVEDITAKNKNNISLLAPKITDTTSIQAKVTYTDGTIAQI